MNFAYPFAEDITVYLNKTAIEYKIYYNLNGGTLDTLSASYTVESGLVFAIPTKDGYRFMGWYKIENFAGEKIETTDNYIEFICFLEQTVYINLKKWKRYKNFARCYRRNDKFAYT